MIGFDARETSPAFAAAVARGLMDAGSEVLSIGMAGTEEMYWAVRLILSDQFDVCFDEKYQLSRSQFGMILKH